MSDIGWVLATLFLFWSIQMMWTCQLDPVRMTIMGSNLAMIIPTLMGTIVTVTIALPMNHLLRQGAPLMISMRHLQVWASWAQKTLFGTSFAPCLGPHVHPCSDSWVNSCWDCRFFASSFTRYCWFAFPPCHANWRLPKDHVGHYAVCWGGLPIGWFFWTLRSILLAIRMYCLHRQSLQEPSRGLCSMSFANIC